ncbi:ATP-grasp domain-containing protein [Oryzihumus leptocrescens]|uniref:ATP-grasp domain-containing protein n=1 Tax=Oryzihumus leptocrescens TaxID=297536 RepID=UPI00163ADDEC|nr:hypothetical protein [Oryzihumus leptocrescens]
MLTNERDYAADRIVHLLHKEGHHVDRWHLDTQATRTIPVDWHPTDEPVSADYDSIWLRQFLPEVTTANTTREVDDTLVSREQWRTWLTDLAEGSRSRWMNPLWASRRAENKLIQLREAGTVGLSVPVTVVTNSRQTAVDHARSHGPCVVKTVASAYHAFSDSSFVFTRPLVDALAAGDAEWKTQPLVVQQRIEPCTDVRVIVVDGFAAAARTSVDGVDWRTRSGDATWVRHELDPSTRKACIALVERLGLVYGAIDLALDDTNHWFLECNQAGEFAFIDTPLELSVAPAIANWLSS